MNHITKTKSEVNNQSFKDIRNRDYPAYIGMDTHKETIATSIANPGRSKPKYLGEMANDPKKIKTFVENISKKYQGEVLLFCYEAGPCGYVLYHQINSLGHDCMVVAPSLIPTKSGERIKTDKRDSQKLARYLRDGSLTSVWIPGTEQEAIRDLTRIRNDFKNNKTKAKQQLCGFVLRHGHSWPAGKTRWTKGYFSWLENLKFKHPWQQIVLQEYINAVVEASEKLDSIHKYLLQAKVNWSLGPIIDSLSALRGIDTLAAMVIISELGDLTRFTHPSQLMCYLGLVPSEHTSSTRRRLGAITKAGNNAARRILVECAWSYRFPARQTAHIKRKSKNASNYAKQVSWKAQKRLCTRYQTFINAGKDSRTTIVAIARELTGFIWDIAVHEMNKLNQQQSK